jgi:hypothetical protein
MSHILKSIESLLCWMTGALKGDNRNSRTMSTSSTTETVSGSVRDLLQAYDVHHTGTEAEGPSDTQTHTRRRQLQPDLPSTSRNAESPPTRDNPNDVSSRRRVPPYRETSRDHDLSSRPGGRDGTEAAVVQVMFLGVYIQAVRVDAGALGE